GQGPQRQRPRRSGAAGQAPACLIGLRLAQGASPLEAPDLSPMSFSIATWNINSVRLRMPLVARFLAEHRPDVLCLQETKCPDALFPLDAFREAGYEHVEISGQKGYHGVATVSRRPL